MGDRATGQVSRTISKKRKASLKDEANKAIYLSVEGPRNMSNVDRLEISQKRFGSQSKGSQVGASHLVNLGEMGHHNLGAAEKNN